MTTNPRITDLLTAALDGLNESPRRMLVAAMRRWAIEAQTPGQTAWWRAVADFAEQPNARTSNAVAAAGLNLAPHVREQERHRLDGASQPGTVVHAVVTAILDLLDTTALPVDVRELDALRDPSRAVVALPITFRAVDGVVVVRGTAVASE